MLHWARQHLLLSTVFLFTNVILISALVFIGIIIYFLKTSDDRAPGPWFSFDESNAYYSVKKDELNNYWLVYSNEKRNDQGITFNFGFSKIFLRKDDKFSSVTVANPEVQETDLKMNNGSMYIGNSKVELDPYLGKSLRIQGSFRKTYTNTQCISGKCHQIFTDPKIKAAVIDIKSIKVLQ